jgi:hypothetical protein
MEIIIIIIVVVGILLSAATKKKPNQSSEDAPPVRPTLSDIQRAFMMSSDLGAPVRHEPEPQHGSSIFGDTAAHQAYTPPVQPELTSRLDKAVSAFESSNKYADIDPYAYHSDSAEIDDAPIKAVRPHKNVLRLFETKDDFVRAVIYSEILTRKGR